MELGERRRTTWPFRTPMPEREEETESTADQTSGKVRWRPEEASMKVVTSRDSLEGKAMGLRLLQKVEFDLEKPLLGSMGGMLICAMGVSGTREVFPLFFFLALKGEIREKVELATKFGVAAEGKMEVRGDPAFVRAACEASLKRLDIDCIDLYYQHRIDTRVPIEITMGELKKLVEEGKIKYIGLSEASPATIRRAHAVHPITAVQLEWSLWSRDVEEEIVPTCRELGIGIVAYSPLGRGFFSSGLKIVDSISNDDFRKYLPRFQPENLEHNKTMFERVNEMAVKKGCTPGQLALAWVHHQGNDVCPIPGTTKMENFNQNIGALSVKLSPEEIAELESIASADAVKGDRYGGSVPTWIDSDTPPLSSWKAE